MNLERSIGENHMVITGSTGILTRTVHADFFLNISFGPLLVASDSIATAGPQARFAVWEWHHFCGLQRNGLVILPTCTPRFQGTHGIPSVPGKF